MYLFATSRDIYGYRQSLESLHCHYRSVWKLTPHGDTSCVASVRMSGGAVQECPSANSTEDRCTTVRVKYVFLPLESKGFNKVLI